MRRSHYLPARGETWWKARMRALVRDDFACRHPDGCTEMDGGPETRLRFLVVHHLKQRIQGGTHDLDNLLTVCKACHVKYHPHLRFVLEVEDHVLEGPPMREL